MKKQLLLAIIALAITPFMAFSQMTIDITPTYAYNFGAKISGYSGGIKVKGAESFGIKIDAMREDGSGIQFSYTNTQSYLNVQDYSHPFYPGVETKFSDVSENYYLLGGIRTFGEGMVQPYGTFSLGAAYYKFTNVDAYYQLAQSDALRFAIGFGLGAKLMFSERIGLDMHIRALAPISYGGIGIGIGTGGASAGVYAGSTFISGDVGGGIIIRLGE